MVSLNRYIVGFFKLTRLKVIVKDFYIGLAIIGIIAARDISFQTLLGLIVTLVILAYTFAINDYEDAEDDIKDSKKKLRNPVSSGFLTKKEALNILIFIAFLAVMLSFVSLSLFPVIVALSSIFIGHLYSWKKVRLKNIPVLDFVSHGYFLAASEVLYFMSLPESNPSFGSVLIFLGSWIFSIGGSLYNEFRDYEVDRHTNISNTASIIKKDVLKWLVAFSYGVGLILITIGIIEVMFISGFDI